MAVTKLWGQQVRFKFTIRNRGGTGGWIAAGCALGVENALKQWTTEPSLTGGETVFVEPGQHKDMDIPVTIPVGTQAKGYGARVWIVDPDTGVEYGHAVIGEAVTILANKPIWELSGFGAA